jgi:hypothetical protein
MEDLHYLESHCGRPDLFQSAKHHLLLALASCADVLQSVPHPVARHMCLPPQFVCERVKVSKHTNGTDALGAECAAQATSPPPPKKLVEMMDGWGKELNNFHIYTRMANADEKSIDLILDRYALVNFDSVLENEDLSAVGMSNVRVLETFRPMDHIQGGQVLVRVVCAKGLPKTALAMPVVCLESGKHTCRTVSLSVPDGQMPSWKEQFLFELPQLGAAGTEPPLTPVNMKFNLLTDGGSTFTFSGDKKLASCTVDLQKLALEPHTLTQRWLSLNPCRTSGHTDANNYGSLLVDFQWGGPRVPKCAVFMVSSELFHSSREAVSPMGRPSNGEAGACEDKKGQPAPVRSILLSLSPAVFPLLPSLPNIPSFLPPFFP